MNMSNRQKTTEKLTQASEGHEVGFEPREAKLAGYFIEDAIGIEEIIDDQDYRAQISES